MPTALSPSPTSSPSSQRSAAIIGGTTAGVFLLLLILATTFLIRRHRLKMNLQERLQSLLRPLRNAREDRGLLDGEDFFDEDAEGALAMRAYRDAYSSSTNLPAGAASRHAASASRSTLATGQGDQSRATTPGGVEPVRHREEEGLGMVAGVGVGASTISSTASGGTSRTNASTSNSQTQYSGLPSTTPAVAPLVNISGLPASTSASESGSSAGAMANMAPPRRASYTLATQPDTPNSLYTDPFRAAAPAPAPGTARDGSVYYTLPAQGQTPGPAPGAGQGQGQEARRSTSGRSRGGR
ncbi:hypothetical protein H0H81_000145 [Sphagnurus paluster]|uniref:Uncharacterized protein n=1 Tax=Sphagnurus paluster TaxID=117069 RepID=A0A9P7FMZ7_9AGAR|nr:hypothetical protein H0H81_000145 [Sphagnurus paluster]